MKNIELIKLWEEIFLFWEVRIALVLSNHHIQNNQFRLLFFCQVFLGISNLSRTLQYSSSMSILFLVLFATYSSLISIPFFNLIILIFASSLSPSKFRPNSWVHTGLPKSFSSPPWNLEKSVINISSKIWYVASSVKSFDSHQWLSPYFYIAPFILSTLAWAKSAPNLSLI